MSSVDQLADLLRRERVVIRERRFGDLESIAQEKRDLLEALSPVDSDDPSLVREVKDLAERNARDLEIIARAARDLRLRLERLGREAVSVAYDPDGEPLDVRSATNLSRRV